VAPLAAFTTYYWRVAASNDSGWGSYSSVATFRTGDQIQDVTETPEAPLKFALFQNYPNPFNPTTIINYDVPRAVQVKLSVFDVLGREVVTLVDAYQPAGRHSVAFDAGNAPTGAYLYRISAGSFNAVRKCVVVK